MPPYLFNTESQEKYNGKVKTTLGNLSKPSSGDNPPFIWPEVTTHDLGTLNEKYKPLRGYIRRLNEFYKNMGIDSSNINNRKCSFQFQPETVVRNVSGNSYDTQYFFNQDPGQLTVPIPGQSTFNIKLLFNREAEVNSNKYLSFDRRLISGFKNPSPSIVDNEDSSFVGGKFNPSWVTKLGVLADILVLDAVIGQGINTETVELVQKIAQKAKEEADKNAPDANATTLTDRQLDAQDRKEFAEKASKFWTGTTSDNPNLGNQAFLVPTPVRIVLSNNMMVEGFVLQSSVNFHKFSRNFIPTQATVELSVQALYIGFAKKTTMLTQDITQINENGPDGATSTEAATEVQKSITEGLKNIYKQGTIEHRKSGKDLLTYLLNTSPLQDFSFSWRTTADGAKFILDTLVPLTGGTPEWFWEGKITMYWNSYVQGAPTPRGLLRTSSGGGTLVKGAPSSAFQPLLIWGKSKEDRLEFATGSGSLKVTEFNSDADGGRKIYTHAIEEGANPWSLSLPDRLLIPRPYEEDKFTVELEIKINVDVSGTMFQVGQMVTYSNVVAAGDDVLFKKLSFTTRPQE